MLLNHTSNRKSYADSGPDIVSRIFVKKLDEFMSDLVDRNCLGECIAWARVIEYQGRGLPHAHILYGLRIVISVLQLSMSIKWSRVN